MERGSAAKAVTGSALALRVADARGPRRPTSGAPPFNGTTGGRGNTRELTGMSWLGYGGPATICGAGAISGRRPDVLLRGAQVCSLHVDRAYG